MNRKKFCVQIVKGLEDVWNENILFDFAVKVQDETIQCHRLILAACSEFFRALFRSGMKEVKENCVVLKDVSCEVFHIILKSIYTGTNLLTLDNFIEVWRAAHMLQVKAMVNVCEEFAIRSCSLDTWENIYENAKILSSKRVLDRIQRFLLEHFEEISLSATFLNMPFNEVQELIKSQDLVVKNEDFVLDSVIKWVEYIPERPVFEKLIENHSFTVSNKVLKSASGVDASYIERDTNVNHNIEKAIDTIKNSRETNASQTARLIDSVTLSRKDKLTELLKQVRTCLVSPAVLSRVLKTNLFSENEDSREIIVDAMSYHSHEFRHGQWPSAAVHRSCSEYTNAGVYVFSGGCFGVIAACDEELFCIKRCKDLEESVQLVNFDGELFATGKQRNRPFRRCRMFVFCDNDWKKVMEMPSLNLLLVSHGNFIYILNKDDQVIYNINPKKRIPILDKVTHFPNDVDVKHTMVIQDFLLLFCSEIHNQIYNTAVYKMDFSSKVWTKLDNLDGPAEHLITFKNDKHNYILQSNGRMWSVLHSACDREVKFVFLNKLWNFQIKLHGGLTFEEKLIILGEDSTNDVFGKNKMKKISGHFRLINYWRSKNCLSFVPMTIPNNALLTLDED